MGHEELPFYTFIIFLILLFFICLLLIFYHLTLSLVKTLPFHKIGRSGGSNKRCKHKCKKKCCKKRKCNTGPTGVSGATGQTGPK